MNVSAICCKHGITPSQVFRFLKKQEQQGWPMFGGQPIDDEEFPLPESPIAGGGGLTEKTYTEAVAKKIAKGVKSGTPLPKGCLDGQTFENEKGRWKTLEGVEPYTNGLVSRSSADRWSDPKRGCPHLENCRHIETTMALMPMRKTPVKVFFCEDLDKIIAVLRRLESGVTTRDTIGTWVLSGELQKRLGVATDWIWRWSTKKSKLRESLLCPTEFAESLGISICVLEKWISAEIVPHVQENGAKLYFVMALRRRPYRFWTREDGGQEVEYEYLLDDARNVFDGKEDRSPLAGAGKVKEMRRVAALEAACSFLKKELADGPRQSCELHALARQVGVSRDYLNSSSAGA